MRLPPACACLSLARAGTLLAAVLVVAPTAGAQGWTRLFGQEGGSEAFVAVEAVGDGTYVAAGRTSSYGPDTDAWVVRFDASGTTMEQLRVDLRHSELPTQLAVLPDGSIALAGSQRQSSDEDHQFLVVLDVSRNVVTRIDQDTFLDHDAFLAVRALPDGSLRAIDRDRRTQTTGGDKPKVMAIRADGAIEWHSSYDPGASSDDGALDLLVAADGSMLVAADAGTWDGFPLLVWLDPAGDVRRAVTLDGGRTVSRLDWIEEGAGFYAAGSRVRWFGTSGFFEAWLGRFDATGALLWQQGFGPAEEGRRATLACVSTMPDGGSVIGGSTSGAVTTSDLGWLARFEPDGLLVWQRSFDFQPGPEAVSDVIALPDGGVIAVGRTSETNGGPSAAWAIRLDADGELAEPCAAMRELDFETTATDWTVVDRVVPRTDASTTAREPAVTVTDTDAVAGPACVGAPPREVSPPGAAVPLTFSDPVTLEWEPPLPSGSDTFSLHRGRVTELATTTAVCLQRDLAAPSAVDADVPDGEGWYYLVVGRNDFGDGPSGSDWAGIPRLLAEACP